MKKQIIFVMFFCANFIFAQKNFIDQPFIETVVKVDSLVVPDRIHISINLNEADSKNKKSVEEQEKLLETTLKSLNINTKKDLSLLDLSSNFKQYFLKGKNVIKNKKYSLLVNNAQTAGSVLTELENVGISNVYVDIIEYSKVEELITELKTKAILKSKQNAEKFTKSLNQKVGKAIYISDSNIFNSQLQGKVPGVAIRGSSSIYGNSLPLQVEFEKIKFEVQIKVNYLLE